MFYKVLFVFLSYMYNYDYEPIIIFNVVYQYLNVAVITFFKI